MNDLKWAGIILVVLWMAWFVTGGPTKFEDNSKPFLNPPFPLGTGGMYGPDYKIDKAITITPFLSSGIQGYIGSNPCKDILTGVRCNDTRPMVILITNSKSKTIKAFQIETNGAFKIPLPAGNYVVWQKSNYTDVALYQHPQQVKVKSFKYKTIQIFFDNKIR